MAAALDFIEAHLQLAGVRQADNDHALMQQREMEAEDGAFLAAVLRGARREHAADLADQRALHPQRTRLVEKRAHLAGHVAVARRRAENDRVVIRQVFNCHDRRRLVKLGADRSEEHTSELQSLMRISYAVFCLKKKKNKRHI